MCSPNIEELFDLKSSFLPVKKKNNKKNHLDFKFCSSGGGGGRGQSNAVGIGQWETHNFEDEKYKLVT